MTAPMDAPVTAPDLERARADLAAADLKLRELHEAHPDRRLWTERKIAAHATIHRATATPAPAPTLTPEQRVAAIRARRETTAALREEPEGTELGAALVDQAIAQSAALHAADALPGQFTPADLRGATREAGFTDVEHAQFVAGLDRLGVSDPVLRQQVAWALRDSPPEDEDALDEAEMLLRTEQWWGAEADAKLEAADRAWQALTITERRALNARRGARPFMEALVKLGQQRRA